MDFGILQEPERAIPELEGFAEAWKKDKQALAIVETYNYPRVQELNLPMTEIYHDQQYVVVMKHKE
jgi:hypothetical protein